MPGGFVTRVAIYHRPFILSGSSKSNAGLSIHLKFGSLKSLLKSASSTQYVIGFIKLSRLNFSLVQSMLARLRHHRDELPVKDFALKFFASTLILNGQ